MSRFKMYVAAHGVEAGRGAMIFGKIDLWALYHCDAMLTII
jgi:hypothetical protein